MNLSTVMDICLSLIVLYALFSILVSILNEWFSHIYNRRSTLLRQAITKIINDPLNHNYAELFFKHYSIEAITRYKYSGLSRFLLLFGADVKAKEVGPQYISSQLFADVLIELISRQHQHQQRALLEYDEQGFAKLDASGNKIYKLVQNTTTKTLQHNFSQSLSELNPSPFIDLLSNFESRSGGDNEKLRSLIAEWFDNYMTRVSGWYKNQQRSKFFILGLIVALGLNIDSLHLYKVMAMDEVLRANLVATGEQVAKNYSQTSDSLRKDVQTQINYFRTSDSLSKKNQREIIKNPASLLRMTDSLRQTQINNLENFIHRYDSVSANYLVQKDEVAWNSSEIRPPHWLRLEPSATFLDAKKHK